MSTRPALTQYWDSETVPDYAAELIGTFRDRNPDFDHRVFSEARSERFISEHFGPRELSAFRACGVPAMQADYFRYCAVLARGGFYADADFECLKPLRPLVDRPEDAILFFGPGEPPFFGSPAKRVWNGFFAFREPGHPLLELTLDIATANVESRLAEWAFAENTHGAKWNSIMGILLSVGPGIFTLLWFMRDLGSFDALRQWVTGIGVRRFVDAYCEVIGDYDRVVKAFEGVRMASSEEMYSWVSHPASGPPKGTHPDWHNWHDAEGMIFR